jgi:hypothetical protein
MPHFLLRGRPAGFYGPICKLGFLMLIRKISNIAYHIHINPMTYCLSDGELIVPFTPFVV